MLQDHRLSAGKYVTLWLSYANYLRMCRDRYGADIIGKGSKYPVAFFEKNEKTNELVAILNSKAKEILKGRK